MTDQVLYRIEENYTNGWELIDPSCKGLIREQCDAKIKELLNTGYNPNYLRAVSDV